jgi:hypothetical protein
LAVVFGLPGFGVFKDGTDLLRMQRGFSLIFSNGMA